VTMRGFRSGSPKSDPIGFLGTTLGKAVAEQAKKATVALRAVQKDMSLNESIKWLGENYPDLHYVTVRPRSATYILEKNKPFPNAEKEVVVG